MENKPKVYRNFVVLQYVFFIAAAVYTFGNTVFVLFGSTKEQKWNRQDPTYELRTKKFSF
jgi:hypothetical protein